MSVEVGWRANSGVNVEENNTFLVDEQNARYRVKRVESMYLTEFWIRITRKCVYK